MQITIITITITIIDWRIGEGEREREREDILRPNSSASAFDTLQTNHPNERKHK